MRSGFATASAVRELIEPTVSGLGYELVEVERCAHGLLRVTVDTAAGLGGIGLDDCERISRQLVHLMAVEGVDYERLEVSSPGLDRVLAGARDFVRFAGAPVQVRLKEPLQGRRRFQGRLLGLDGPFGEERVRLQVEPLPQAQPRSGGRVRAARSAVRTAEPPETFEFPLAAIEKARLVPQFNFSGAAKVDEKGGHAVRSCDE